MPRPNTLDPRALWSAGLDGLAPYVPGEQPRIPGLIKLNTNENPYPPSPAALEAIRAAAGADLRLYPDPDGQALKQTIADLHGLTPAHVFLGNGSDEVLGHAFMALLRHPGRPVLFPDVSYSFYPVWCGLYGIEWQAVSVDEALAIEVDAYARPHGGIVLPNPNAPTGRALGLDALRRLLAASPDAAVIIDEAYVDFGAESAAALVPGFRNLLVVHTLSKSRSLAGLRVGFALGDPVLVEALERVKGSFNSYPLDRLALAGARAALQDTAHFDQTRRQVMASREGLSAQLGALGFEVLPSAANFVFARHPARTGAALMQALRERRILVRHFAKPRIADYLRITVGTEAECQALVAALGEILSA